MITRDEATDLQSHIARTLSCELALQLAKLAAAEAARNLASAIHQMQKVAA